MEKIRIQKISNGQFCTAKEFIIDMKENETRVSFPEIETDYTTAEKNIDKMRLCYGRYITTATILVKSGLVDFSGEGGNGLPSFNCYGHIACPYNFVPNYENRMDLTKNENAFLDFLSAEMDKRIEEQEKIVAKINQREIYLPI